MKKDFQIRNLFKLCSAVIIMTFDAGGGDERAPEGEEESPEARMKYEPPKPPERFYIQDRA